MFKIEKAECKKITSEPGDMTLYSYFIHRLSTYEFSFAPNKSTFKFPQKLCYFDIENINTEEEYIDLAQKHNCNPHTLKECINCIKLIIGEK